jgi:hypothetical protein
MSNLQFYHSFIKDKDSDEGKEKDNDQDKDNEKDKDIEASGDHRGYGST